VPQPICFMVMPFGVKETGAKPPAPARVDFDGLWEKALLPAIEELGYEPVRADQDLGAMIVRDMIERLYFSDLVVADLTIPNGNVYYEVGVRHVAKRAGCVLIGADWSSQLFDLNQIRQLRYPLPEGEIDEASARAIRAALRGALGRLAEGATPVFQTLPGYPDEVIPDQATVIRKFLEELSAFQARVRSVRHAPAGERRARALALRDEFPAASIRLPNLAQELLDLLRDYADGSDLLAYVEQLPAAIRELPVIHEQRCLAQSNAGDHATAIGALEELVRTSGDSSERQGLLGGRYKRLLRAAGNPSDRARYLGKAIEHYERGMMLDLNDYYPSCNLPGLYRDRNRRGDAERALAAATVARLACERAIARQTDDGWTRPTLLGLAFFEGNVEVVDDLYNQISADGAARWKLDTTIADLEGHVSRTEDADRRAVLAGILARLKALL
jgi:hypothetical protein